MVKFLFLIDCNFLAELHYEKCTTLRQLTEITKVTRLQLFLAFLMGLLNVMILNIYLSLLKKKI